MPSLFQDSIDDDLLFERIESFGGGEDSFTRSTLLPQDVSQRMINVMVKDKLEAGTRPGTVALGAAARTAAVQALNYFDTPGVEQLVAVNNGAFEYWNGSAWAAMSGFTVDPAVRPAMAQGVDKLLISDGSNNLRTWDGSAFTDEGSGTNAPPAGANILCFSAGRMFAAGFSGAVAGKENDAIWASALLNFQAGGWDGTERQFRIGGGDGDPITAMDSLPQNQLAVLKENSVWVVNVNPSLAIKDYSAQVIAKGIGCVGRDARVVVGNDVYFMARDGVRSLQRMAAAAGQFEVNPPLSLPVQTIIDRINWQYANTICAGRHNEFVFFFLPLDTAQTPNVAIVFNSRLGRWIGRWTGWNARCCTVSRFSGINRFVFGDSAGYVQQWNDYSSDTSNATYQDLSNVTASAAYPATTLWTRGMFFGDPVIPKDLFESQVRFSAGSATVTAKANLDNADVFTWSTVLAATGSRIGVDVLPWKLATNAPSLDQQGLRGNPAFNEMFLKLESGTGWFKVRNVTVAAFSNAMKGK